jgi:hypothetical protein
VRDGIVGDSQLSRLGHHRIGVRAEHHVPHREHRGIVRVALAHVGRVVKAMKFRRDENPVDCGGDFERTVSAAFLMMLGQGGEKVIGREYPTPLATGDC